MGDEVGHVYRVLLCEFQRPPKSALVFFEQLVRPSEVGTFLIDLVFNDPLSMLLCFFVFLLTVPLNIVMGKPFFQDFAK